MFDVYVTSKTKKVKIIDFNVWGGMMFFLFFEWYELEVMNCDCVEGDDVCGYVDEIEFRIIES